MESNVLSTGHTGRVRSFSNKDGDFYGRGLGGAFYRVFFPRWRLFGRTKDRIVARTLAYSPRIVAEEVVYGQADDLATSAAEEHVSGADRSREARPCPRRATLKRHASRIQCAAETRNVCSRAAGG
ncbi:hypothetical protein ACRALDRAFT_2035830 [Sodiomyces alcalophilus JCM 7366]|uniref:uncharacterized protein n=1 Tax=Sodiomyces alcalophilus JCM 7366 TaxID=591952 RepID=UPI0039B69C22